MRAEIAPGRTIGLPPQPNRAKDVLEQTGRASLVAATVTSLAVGAQMLTKRGVNLPVTLALGGAGLVGSIAWGLARGLDPDYHYPAEHADLRSFRLDTSAAPPALPAPKYGKPVEAQLPRLPEGARGFQLSGGEVTYDLDGRDYTPYLRSQRFWNGAKEDDDFPMSFRTLRTPPNTEGAHQIELPETEFTSLAAAMHEAKQIAGNQAVLRRANQNYTLVNSTHTDDHGYGFPEARVNGMYTPETIQLVAWADDGWKHAESLRPIALEHGDAWFAKSPDHPSVWVGASIDDRGQSPKTSH